MTRVNLRSEQRNKPHHSLHPAYFCVPAAAEPVEMESMQELIPFAKEMLSQKPNRGLLKVYLLGSVFAVLGTVIGLVETVCHPFSSGESLDAEMVLLIAREQRTVEAETQHSVQGQVEEEEEEVLAHENGAATMNMNLNKTHRLSQRSITNRLHAS
ncbi:G0/G1 switch protein 2-like [Plectropomus leopardus]|uniref:G0/G1 switch protein 2-like n=1 Tax=Plectropomus leopardus TaxID=160734 RepID=UPI001C4D1E73|nr:G0/G1 switch protein 2-like [Plectropomus leopardus]